MRAHSIIGEAWRNIRTGTTRAVLFAALLTFFSVVLALADMVSIVDLEERAERFHESGAAIRILTADSLVEPRSCDALDTANTIQSAGALTAGQPATVDALPSGSIPVFAVTPGMADVLQLEPSSPRGVWVSDELAETLRAHVGTVVQSAEGTLEISGIFTWPDDGRDSRLSHAILIPQVADEMYDECWATVWPTSTESESLLRFASAVESSSDTPLTVSQVNRNHGAEFDGSEEYEKRTTRLALPLSAVVGFFVAFVSVRLRRLEYASALHAGQSRLTAMATVLLETLLWSAVSALLATAVVVVTAHVLSSGGAEAIATTCTRIVAAAAASTCAGSAVAVIMVREKHLFRYFKDR